MDKQRLHADPRDVRLNRGAEAPVVFVQYISPLRWLCVSLCASGGMPSERL